VNRLENQMRRPTVASLRAVTHAWDARTNARIMIAHLEDEIIRAGHAPTAYRIHPADRDAPADIAAACADLDRIAAADPETAAHVAALVSDVWRMLSDSSRGYRISAAAPAHARAAGPAPTYHAKSPRASKNKLRPTPRAKRPKRGNAAPAAAETHTPPPEK